MTGSGVVEIDKLMAAGRELGYTGEELKVWVAREKNIQKEEWLQAREAAKEEHSAQESTSEAQERACQAECVRLDKEREVLQLRITAQERKTREARGEGGEGSSTGPNTIMHGCLLQNHESQLRLKSSYPIRHARNHCEMQYLCTDCNIFPLRTQKPHKERFPNLPVQSCLQTLFH